MISRGKLAKNVGRTRAGNVHSTSKLFQNAVVVVGTQGQQNGAGLQAGGRGKEMFAGSRWWEGEEHEGPEQGFDLGALAAKVTDLLQECVFGAFMQAGQELMGQEDADRRKQPIPESGKLEEGLASELCAKLWNKLGLTTNASQEYASQQAVEMYQRAVMDPLLRERVEKTWKQLRAQKARRRAATE